MRIRSLLTLGTGMALGAGAAYLGDPDHGPRRRGQARTWAFAQGRAQAGVALGAAARSVRGCASAAMDGYRESQPAARATSE